MRAIDLTQERWARVRIDNVDERRPAKPASAGSVAVSACVHLGQLAPAHVEVELVARDGGKGMRAHTRRARHRLCSVMSYDNGSFLFEASVPAADLQDPDGYVVRVTPSSAFGDVADLPPVVRRVPPRAVGAVRRPSADAARDVAGRVQCR